MEYRKSLLCVGGIHFNLDHQGNSMEGGDRDESGGEVYNNGTEYSVRKHGFKHFGSDISNKQKTKNIYISK